MSLRLIDKGQIGLCLCYRPVALYHQVLSVFNGLSDGVAQLYLRYVCCHPRLPRTGAPHPLGGSPAHHGRLRTDCQVSFLNDNHDNKNNFAIRMLLSV